MRGCREEPLRIVSQDMYFGGHPLLALKGKLPFRVTFPDGHFPVTDSI